ncbi:DUF2784 domain-containing protein [Candidatus Poriferisodalis sp.]|uniref:DUF2784 domain-containing protein n=1 Tax=Candidatus Poriferisodalis sp. TaxID=3101277 RepID=UPI003B02D679
MAWLAAAVALFHGLLAVFVVVGAPLVVRRRRLMPWYLAVVLPIAAINIPRLPCVLTVWEKDLWRLAGQAPYRGGFISHYFIKPFHAPGLDATGESVLVVIVSAWCLAWLAFASTTRLRSGAQASRVRKATPRAAAMR